MLVDRYGRPLTHMRITVTRRCNYRCVYCHGEGEETGGGVLSPEDIGVIAEAAVGLGIRYFKLTGGEPLVRSDLEEVIAAVKEAGADEVSLVTNGYYLRERLPGLLKAGLDRVNVSLPSLNPSVYERITGVRGLDRVLAGISALTDSGVPVKLNFVLLRWNVGEVPALLEYASSVGADVNIIELVPLGSGREVFGVLYEPISGVKRYLEEAATESYRRDFQGRPVYVLPSGIRVELVESLGNPEFCAQCRRIRLTHDGKLKTCLFQSEGLIDLLPMLRSGLERNRLVELVSRAIREANNRRKPYFRHGR